MDLKYFFRRRGMEHKYVLKKKETELIIQEQSETEPGKFALLFEEKLPRELVEETLPKGKPAVVDLFRSRHFYPPSIFADLLASGIENMFQDENKDSMTLQFNDNDALGDRDGVAADLLVDEKELAEIDKLLEDGDDMGDEFED